MQILLKSGGGIDAGRALLMALLRGRKEVVQILHEEGADDDDFGYALALALGKGYPPYEQVVKSLLEYVDTSKALGCASSGGYKAIVQILLEGGADLKLGTHY